METDQLTPLAAELESQRLTQREFAQRISMSEAQVNRWVRGRSTPIRAHRELIARKLKVSEETLWPNI